MLEVTSPDYSQLLATYLKAQDAFRVADKNYARAQDLYAAQRHRRARPAAGRIRPQSGAGGPECIRAGHENSGHQESGRISRRRPSSAQIPLLAPIGGEVVERLVSPGQVMQAGQTQAFTISDMSTVWVLANVYQAIWPTCITAMTSWCRPTLIPTAFTERFPSFRPRWIRIRALCRRASWWITPAKN